MGIIYVDFMKTIRAWLPAVLFLWGSLLGMPFYHIPTFTKGPLICALIGQEKNVYEIFTQPHLWTYRPLLVLMFSTLYKLFGFHYEPYRILAAAFSGFFALFVYLFLLELHPSRKIAFFSTFIFTLTTPFLDGLWDLSEGGFYSTCLFYGAFLFFVKLSKCDGNHKLENRYTFLFLLFSLLSLLIKETTRAMAPPILFLYCYFLKVNKKQWKLFWIFCVLSVLTLLPVLSAPPEPGSRAAVTTPLLELAKISFQIHVTQLMSVFHISMASLLLVYGVLLFLKPSPPIFHSFPVLHKANFTSVKYWLNVFLNIITLLISLIVGIAVIGFFVGLRRVTGFTFATYFSAKYFTQESFHIFITLALILFIAFILIGIYGNSAEKLSCSGIAFTFIGYYSIMTFITTLRLEPSSRHYLLILPFLCFLICQCFIKILHTLASTRFRATKIFTGVVLFSFCATFAWGILTGTLNLRREFTIIGSFEFSAWEFLVKNGVKDTVIFSPADGYALPQEYLQLAVKEGPFSFFQIPRWFPSASELDSHLRHTIDINKLKTARKIFYYSGYTYYFTDDDYTWEKSLEFSAKGFKPYTKIGYWNHILTMNRVYKSPLETYLAKHAKLIYKKKTKLIGSYFNSGYYVNIYVQEPKNEKQ